MNMTIKLPTEWKIKSLGELGDFKNGINKEGTSFGKGYPLVNLMDVFGKLILQSEDFGLVDSNDDEREVYNLKKGDVLFVRSSVKPEGVGLTILVDQDLKDTVYSGFLIRFRPTDELSHNFKKHCFFETGFRLRLIRHSTISAVTNINQESLKKLWLFIPPLDEQLRIAAILSTWDEAIEKTERLIEGKEKHYLWLLSNLISNSKYPHGHIRDFTTEVSKRNSDGTIDRVLSVTNDRGFVLPEEQFERRVASSDLSNYKVVIIGQYAYNPSRINVGSIARLSDWQSGVLSPMYVVFKINDKKVNSDFFLHWLESHEAKERIRKSAQGSVRETVSFTDLGAIPFPLPPLDQQEQIAETLNTAQQEIELLKRQAEAYRKQKRGLMQKLLTGEWRVKVK